MTGNFIFDGFIVFFVCYGLIMFFHAISEALLRKHCQKTQDVFSVLYIEKAPNALELTVRCAMQKSLAERRNLLVLYDELLEEEIFMLWRLCDGFKNVFIAQKEDAADAIFRTYQASSKDSL